MGALVLTRKPGQIIKIGDDIEVQVLGVKGNQVNIAVAAPKHIAVGRAEVRQRKDAGIPPRKFA